MMDPNARVMGLDAQGNVVFTVVKPVVGVFQVSSDPTVNAPQGGMGLQGLSENTIIIPQSQAQVDQNQDGTHPLQPHVQISVPSQTENVPQNQDLPPASECTTQMPFAEVSSLLDPNMKGSKARKLVCLGDEAEGVVITGPPWQESISSPTRKSRGACRLQRRCPCAR